MLRKAAAEDSKENGQFLHPSSENTGLYKTNVARLNTLLKAVQRFAFEHLQQRVCVESQRLEEEVEVPLCVFGIFDYGQNRVLAESRDQGRTFQVFPEEQEALFDRYGWFFEWAETTVSAGGVSFDFTVQLSAEGYHIVFLAEQCLVNSSGLLFGGAKSSDCVVYEDLIWRDGGNLWWRRQYVEGLELPSATKVRGAKVQNISVYSTEESRKKPYKGLLFSVQNALEVLAEGDCSPERVEHALKAVRILVQRTCAVLKSSKGHSLRLEQAINLTESFVQSSSLCVVTFRAFLGDFLSVKLKDCWDGFFSSDTSVLDHVATIPVTEEVVRRLALVTTLRSQFEEFLDQTGNLEEYPQVFDRASYLFQFYASHKNKYGTSTDLGTLSTKCVYGENRVARLNYLRYADAEDVQVPNFEDDDQPEYLPRQCVCGEPEPVDEVGAVLCTKCQSWFHEDCVGHEVPYRVFFPGDDFECLLCSDRVKCPPKVTVHSFKHGVDTELTKDAPRVSRVFDWSHPKLNRNEVLDRLYFLVDTAVQTWRNSPADEALSGFNRDFNLIHRCVELYHRMYLRAFACFESKAWERLDEVALSPTGQLVVQQDANTHSVEDAISALKSLVAVCFNSSTNSWDYSVVENYKYGKTYLLFIACCLEQFALTVGLRKVYSYFKGTLDGDDVPYNYLLSPHTKLRNRKQPELLLWRLGDVDDREDEDTTSSDEEEEESDEVEVEDEEDEEVSDLLEAVGRRWKEWAMEPVTYSKKSKPLFKDLQSFKNWLAEEPLRQYLNYQAVERVTLSSEWATNWQRAKQDLVFAFLSTRNFGTRRQNELKRYLDRQARPDDPREE